MLRKVAPDPRSSRIARCLGQLSKNYLIGTARQAPDRFHFLRLPQLFFETPLLRNIVDSHKSRGARFEYDVM